MDNMIDLVIISGRSGSGKSVALRVLEDLGYYCIDNLPVVFLAQLVKIAKDNYPKLAVSIDIRNMPTNTESLEKDYFFLKETSNLKTTSIYIDADDQVLIKRYLETRRLHPLSRKNLSLDKAIVTETRMLESIRSLADIRVDTSNMSIHQLSNFITNSILGHPEKKLLIVFESFGFKNGIAKDADFVFDSRFLPNPYWEVNLRKYTGLDQCVIDFFKKYKEVDEYVDQIDNLLMSHLPTIEKSNRSYLTVAIGCTGGCHRSVYIAQSLHNRFNSRNIVTQVRHCTLEGIL